MFRGKVATRRLSLVFFLLFASLMRCQPSITQDAQPPPIRRVLIIYEQNPSYPAVGIIDEAIRESLKDTKYRIEVYREYLDANLFPDQADQEQFREFYIRKYENRRPDVIVTVGSTALHLVRELHKTSFAGIPVVYCLPGVENAGVEAGFTGVTMGIDAAGTLDAALRLLPKTQHVVVLGGVAPFDREQLQVVRQQLQPYSNRVDISYVSDLAMPEIQAKLRGLSAGTIVLLVSISSDAAGTKFNSRQAAPLIISASRVPVFALFDVYIGHGEVGGDFSVIKAQGTMAASAVMRILDGADPSDVPVAKAPNAFVFDWRALERWGLSERALPAGSTILYREPTAWEIYRWYFIGAVALMLLQAALISALLWQRRKRRRTEQDLEITNERLRLAVSVGKSVGWDTDFATGENRWFGDLNALFGTSDDKSVNSGDFLEFVHPDDKTGVSQAIADARQDHKPFVAEFRIVRKDGALRWVNSRGEFFYSGPNTAARMIGRAADITDRKLAELKLQESERRFRLLADTAPVMIWTSGTDAGCNYFNKPWLEFTGRTLDQEFGDGWIQNVHPEDLEDCLSTYREAFGRRERFEMQYRLRRFDGEYRWLFDIGIPRSQPDGSFAGYIGSCLDVTERRAAEEALANLSGRLIAAQEEERKRIAREIHDDYQQRLALLASDLDTLGGNTDNASMRERAREIWNEISELAFDMHSLSHRLHSSTLDTLGLVAGVKAFCEEFQQQQGLQVAFHSSNVPRSIPPDSALCVFRVAQEALRNVKRHSGADRADVQLERTGTALHLKVSDGGKGFDPKNPSPGAGIGIRSMEERLRLLGGTLELRSQPSQGTTVEAWVPLSASAQCAD